MSDELRCYFVIDAGATRTLAQWIAVKQAAVSEPLCHALTLASVYSWGGLFLCRYSINPARRYLQGKFEMDADQVDTGQRFIDAQCTARSISKATYRLRVEALLQAELREAATAAGYGTIASQITVAVIGWGKRIDAINAAHGWLMANRAAWEA